MKKFSEYYNNRLLEEGFFDKAKEMGQTDVFSLIHMFATKLIDSLLEGIRSLPSQAIDALKRATMEYKTARMSEIDIYQPLTDKDIENANRMLGLNQDPKEVKYLLDIYRRNLKNFIPAGTPVDAKSYYSQMQNFFKDPQHGVSHETMVRPAKDAVQVVRKVAEEIKDSVASEYLRQMIDKSLAEVLSDAQLRDIAWNGRNTSSGKEYVNRSLLSYNRTHKDLSSELRGNPDFRRRWNRIQREKRAYRKDRQPNNDEVQ